MSERNCKSCAISCYRRKDFLAIKLQFHHSPEEILVSVLMRSRIYVLCIELPVGGGVNGIDHFMIYMETVSVCN